MHLTSRFLAAALLVLGASQAHAQQTALYRTTLLRDAAANPYQAVFEKDDGEKSAIGFLNTSSFTQYTNSAGVIAASYTFGDLLDTKKRDKILGSSLTKGRSSLFNQNEFYTFQLRFRVRKDKRGEFSVNNSTVTDTRLYLSNNLLRLFLYGNKQYAGLDLSGAFDVGLSALAYNKTAIGYRQDFGSKLSLGGSLNLYQGIVNGRAVIENTQFSTSPNGDSLVLNYNGESDFSTGFNGNIAKAGFKDFGKFVNLGLGASLGAEYRYNDKFSFTAAVKDWGVIKWNHSGYNYSLHGRTNFQGLNALDNGYLRGNGEQILKRIGAYANDSSRGSYSTRLIPNLELGVNAKWNNRVRSAFVITRQGFIKNYQFSLLTDLRLIRKLHGVLNLGTGTLRNQMVGLSVYYESQKFQFYVGSEQLSNLAIKGTNLGVDGYLGFGFRF